MVTPDRQAGDPGGHEEKHIRSTDPKSVNESEEANDYKPVEKAKLVNKWCSDN